MEYMRPELATEEIAARVFAPRERAWLAALPLHLRQEAFFRGWTRKEAYVKGTGTGLSTDPRDIEVSILPDVPAALLSVRGESRGGSQLVAERA